MDICSFCDGSGTIEEECYYCGGEGVIPQNDVEEPEIRCDECCGTGYLEELCPYCDGECEDKE